MLNEFTVQSGVEEWPPQPVSAASMAMVVRKINGIENQPEFAGNSFTDRALLTGKLHTPPGTPDSA
jgi:hypothetical protein